MKCSPMKIAGCIIAAGIVCYPSDKLPLQNLNNAQVHLETIYQKPSQSTLYQDDDLCMHVKLSDEHGIRGFTLLTEKEKYEVLFESSKVIREYDDIIPFDLEGRVDILITTANGNRIRKQYNIIKEK